MRALADSWKREPPTTELAIPYQDSFSSPSRPRELSSVTAREPDTSNLSRGESCFSERVGMMRDGKLLQMGVPDKIYNRPADLFVANFTGATNELVGMQVECCGAFVTIDISDGARLEVALMLCGRRMEVLELGTAARHQVQTDARVSLPREACWAYRDTGVSVNE